MTETDPPILTERSGHWLRIWFNRPESRNALSSEMSEALTHALTSVRDDRTVRGISFRGKGGTFCAGGDLKGFRAAFAGEAAREPILTMSRSAGELFWLIDSMPQVTLMLIEGAAMAGGLGIAACGDVVASTADARFALTETTLGISPAQIAPFVIRRLGPAPARRLMLTAAKFDGVEAQRLGLVDFLAKDSAGLEHVEAEVMAQVGNCAPGALAVTKAIARAAPGLHKDAMIEMAAEGFADCLLGPEGVEGISAFLQKRKPGWAEE